LVIIGLEEAPESQTVSIHGAEVRYNQWQATPIRRTEIQSYIPPPDKMTGESFIED